MKMNSTLPFLAVSGDQDWGTRVIFQTQQLCFSGFGDDKVLLEWWDLKGNEISCP